MPEVEHTRYWSTAYGGAWVERVWCLIWRVHQLSSFNITWCFLLQVCRITIFLASFCPFYVWHLVYFYVQSTQGWLLVCNYYFMPTDWVINIDVLPVYWSWWTLLLAVASKFDNAWFIIHFLDEFGACFWVLFATKGSFSFRLCIIVLPILGVLFHIISPMFLVQYIF